MRLFRKKAPKCKCCKKENAKAYILKIPLCQNCLLQTRHYTNIILDAIKEENWQVDDRKEIAALEKRLFTRGKA